MFGSKTFLAIVPARGGSKRLPQKNILELANKPLIAWTIDSGLKSKFIDTLMVTSDDDSIIKVALKYGAEVPFKRPDSLATDTALRPDVIRHTINHYQNLLNKTFDYIIYLQPTSPLRNESHIDAAIEYMFANKAEALISLCELEHPIQWTGVLPENNDLSSFLSDNVIKSRSQDFKKYYRLNGAIYICKVNRFLEEGSMFLQNNIIGFKMAQDVSVDIDTELDFKIADVLIKHLDIKD